MLSFHFPNVDWVIQILSIVVMLWEISGILINGVYLWYIQIALVKIHITHIHPVVDIDMADVLQVDILGDVLALIVTLNTVIGFVDLLVH